MQCYAGCKSWISRVLKFFAGFVGLLTELAVNTLLLAHRSWPECKLCRRAALRLRAWSTNCGVRSVTVGGEGECLAVTPPRDPVKLLTLTEIRRRRIERESVAVDHVRPLPLVGGSLDSSRDDEVVPVQTSPLVNSGFLALSEIRQRRALRVGGAVGVSTSPSQTSTPVEATPIDNECEEVMVCSHDLLHELVIGVWFGFALGAVVVGYYWGIPRQFLDGSAFLDCTKWIGAKLGVCGRSFFSIMATFLARAFPTVQQMVDGSYSAFLDCVQLIGANLGVYVGTSFFILETFLLHAYPVVHLVSYESYSAFMDWLQWIVAPGHLLCGKFFASVATSPTHFDQNGCTTPTHSYLLQIGSFFLLALFMVVLGKVAIWKCSSSTARVAGSDAVLDIGLKCKPARRCSRRRFPAARFTTLHIVHNPRKHGQCLWGCASKYIAEKTGLRFSIKKLRKLAAIEYRRMHCSTEVEERLVLQEIVKRYATQRWKMQLGDAEPSCSLTRRFLRETIDKRWGSTDDLEILRNVLLKTKRVSINFRVLDRQSCKFLGRSDLSTECDGLCIVYHQHHFTVCRRELKHGRKTSGQRLYPSSQTSSTSSSWACGAGECDRSCPFHRVAEGSFLPDVHLGPGLSHQAKNLQKIVGVPGHCQVAQEELAAQHTLIGGVRTSLVMREDVLFVPPGSGGAHSLFSSCLFVARLSTAMDNVYLLRSSVASLLRQADSGLVPLAGRLVSDWATDVQLSVREFIGGLTASPFRTGNFLEAFVASIILGCSIWTDGGDAHIVMRSHTTRPRALIQADCQGHYCVVELPDEVFNRRTTGVQLMGMGEPRLSSLRSLVEPLLRGPVRILLDRYRHYHYAEGAVHFRIIMVVVEPSEGMHEHVPAMCLNLAGLRIQRELPSWTSLVHVGLEVDVDTSEPAALFDIFREMDRFVLSCVAALCDEIFLVLSSVLRLLSQESSDALCTSAYSSRSSLTL
eukprot:6463879-Amphidinium_carterae.2